VHDDTRQNAEPGVTGRGLAEPDLSAPVFSALVRRHRPACLLLARRVLRDHQMAEDAVQEAFFDAWRQSARYDAARSTEVGWLMTLTHRRAVDRVRKEERHGAVVPAADACADALVDPLEEQVWRAERASCLRRALPGLTSEQYEVLVLAYFGGYTQREIAGLVGIPIGTVKTRTVAAMRRLAVVLRDAGLEAT
jgi:RNA polymerase sigma-70 factor (ECF subfamily)